MKYLLTAFLCLTVSTAWSQKPPTQKSPPQKSKTTIDNPFDAAVDSYGMEDMGMGMDEMMDMGGMGGGMEMGGMEDMMAGGMGMAMGMESAPSADDRFRANLPRAIQQLKQSKTKEERTTLQRYIREAFEQRYDRVMAKRTKDIQRLRKSLQELENDLKRRSAAKERVVQLQLQSVQLAAEGLLELNDLQGFGRSADRMGGMGGMDDEYGGGMGN